MTPTLLLDLDDTLLINKTEVFLPKYLASFSRHVAEFIHPDLFVQTLLTGTEAMVANQQPDCTLQEIFDQAFFRKLSVNKDEFHKLADQFYADIFPSLKDFTSPADGAVELVNESLEKGFRLVIATNPLFPLSAIKQRLAWAGLPTDEYPFADVTSYESYHFAKPEPAYFAEIIARLGWPDGPVVMVGDDLERDIIPASSLGLATYYIGNNSAFLSDSGIKPTGSGSLMKLLDWMDNISERELTPKYDSPVAVKASLRSTPAVLDSLCCQIPVDAWTRKPGLEEWCLTEVICHLRDVELEVNLPRFEKVLSEDNPFISGKDTDRWAHERDYFNQDGMQALHEYISARKKVLEILDNLPMDDWNLPARHAIFGPTRLLELAGIQASHDRVHVQQVLNLQKFLKHP